MEKIILNGVCKLFFAPEAGDLPQNIEEVREKNFRCVEATVPGNVELDLVKAGILPEPFYADNIFKLREYEHYQWWYEKEFEVPHEFNGKKTFLIFHGLDTLATIWVNKKRVAETDNMLIEYEIDVTDALRYGGKNKLVVRIRSALNEARNKEYPPFLRESGTKYGDLWIRKAPHMFGWDIAPRAVSAGIWRDAELIARDNTYIKSVYYYTKSIDEKEAILGVHFQFATDKTYLDEFSILIEGKCKDHRFAEEFKLEFLSGTREFLIPGARLWYPKWYGEQNLYDVRFKLFYRGKFLDERDERIGLRRIEIVKRDLPGDKGEFLIKVNDIPILARGSNWVPLDAFHSRDKKRLKPVHDLFEDLGCNIIRCWGGNVYEDKEFFDLCDERGVLVWQDFAFACSRYPQTENFIRKVQKEAKSVITKLRNHTSLMLWCGDNEVDQVYLRDGLNPADNIISRQVLKQMVHIYDPYRTYVPTSPYFADIFVKTKSRDIPEQHLWGPRDYFKGEFYKNATSHFISEIGYHGCPNVSSIKKFISRENIWPWQNNREWAIHDVEPLKYKKRNYSRTKLMVDQVRTLFGKVPDSLEDFVLASQISQAEAKKFFIEMVRLGKWRKTGIIWWNVMDCWPQFSDAIVDYYFGKKLAYHYIRRMQRPIVIMISEPLGWRHEVILGNDGNRDALVKYIVSDGETGKTLLKGEKLSTANENVKIGELENFKGVRRFYLMSWQINGQNFGNHYISGYPPFNLGEYKRWLKKIALLSKPFDIDKIGR